MRLVANRFQTPTDRAKEKVTRAVSPTAEDFQALDQEVEKLHSSSRALIMDYFSQVMLLREIEHFCF